MMLLLGAALTALPLCLVFIIRLYIVLKTGPNHKPGARGPVAVLVVAGSGGHTTEILRLLEYMSAAYTPRHYVIADTDRMSEEKICTFEKFKQQSDSKSQFTICRIPRSREVHQSWSSSVVSTLNALWYSLPLVFRIRPDMRAGELVAVSDQCGEDYSTAVELYDDFSRLHSSSVWFPVNPNSLSLFQSWGHLFIPSPSAFMSEQPSLVLCNGPGTCIPLCVAGLLLGILGMKKVLIVYVESICRVQTLSLTGKILYPLSDYFFVQWSSLRDKYPKSIFLGRIV